jgi:hypothetical protein
MKPLTSGLILDAFSQHTLRFLLLTKPISPNLPTIRNAVEKPRMLYLEHYIVRWYALQSAMYDQQHLVYVILLHDLQPYIKLIKEALLDLFVPLQRLHMF